MHGLFDRPAGLCLQEQAHAWCAAQIFLVFVITGHNTNPWTHKDGARLARPAGPAHTPPALSVRRCAAPAPYLAQHGVQRSRTWSAALSGAPCL